MAPFRKYIMPTPEYDGIVTSDVNESEEDKKLLVAFYMEAVRNATKSAIEGRPIFDEIPMVKIMTPGSKDIMVNRATEKYQLRFPRQWDMFKRKLDQAVEGTPLEQVPFLTVGQIAELKAFNCLTLEQLAGMSDQNAAKFMGAHSMRQKAQTYLAAAKDTAPLTHLQNELEKRDNEIAALKNQVAQLMAAVQKHPQIQEVKS